MSATEKRRRKIRPADPIWDWFDGAQPLADLVPLELENGAVIDELSSGCRGCRIDDRPDETRGELRNHGPTSFWLRIGGVCRSCRTLNMTTLIIEPDGTGLKLIDISDEVADPFVHSARSRPLSGTADGRG